MNNEEYQIKKGDVFIIGRDTVHGYKSPKNFRICNIMYRHNVMFSGLPDISSSAGFQALFVLEPCLAKNQSFKSRLSLKRENYRTVKMLIDKMLNEYKSDSECRKTALTAIFMQLAVTLSRIYSFDQIEQEQDIINIAKAVSYIENNFSKTIFISELAEISHYSERHFTRTFKKAYGVSPAAYIINLRINYACSLLKYSNMSISETAEKCGFDDVNYFSRLFKKRMGITPSKYKKEL